MERTLTLTITTNADIGTFDVDILEGESGIVDHIRDVPFSPDEHPKFDEAIGNEVYGWVAIMMDEEEENNDEDF